MRDDVMVVECPACEGQAVTRAGAAACLECWWVAEPEWLADLQWPESVTNRSGPMEVLDLHEAACN